MKLWREWVRCVYLLRTACTRKRTFFWMCLVLVGFTVRSELAGVTSFVRALSLPPCHYRGLLHLFHSDALVLKKLTLAWNQLALTLFTPLQVGNRYLIVADGIKVAKEGLKMPSVKKLHQESTDNSKPAYIFGHSFQALGLLVAGPYGKVVSVPLVSRIHEGIITTNRDRRTLLDKLAALFLETVDGLSIGATLVADAYYASRKIILPLLKAGHHLVTRVRSNAVAYRLPEKVRQPGQRGRPKKYGDKIHFRQMWRFSELFQSAQSPVYGESNLMIHYLSMDLLWRPVGQLVRFVWVKHPTRGRLILLSTDLSMDPLSIVALYGYRFKIEVAFKQALHTIGAYAYHFWMKAMTPRPCKSGNQYLPNKHQSYRKAVHRKIAAYHRYVQLGCVAQGLLQHLSLHYHDAVWGNFRSWLRTMNPSLPPSEAVVTQAMRNTLPEFLSVSTPDPIFAKLIDNQIDFSQPPELLLTG